MWSGLLAVLCSLFWLDEDVCWLYRSEEIGWALGFLRVVVCKLPLIYDECGVGK